MRHVPRSTLVWLAGVFMLIAVPTFAQETRPPGEQKEKQADLANTTFGHLQSQRDSLNTQIVELEQAIRETQALDSWFRDQENATLEYRRLQSDAKATPNAKEFAKKKLDEIDNSIRTYSNLGIKTRAEIPEALRRKQTELTARRNHKDIIETEMNRRIDLEGPKQAFKATISIYFTILVGLVIFGFFFVALRDESLRREIFAGQAGIQFVTLFAVIIAIILFGITGILEGKELAALLGGLSGYILGRQK